MKKVFFIVPTLLTITALVGCNTPKKDPFDCNYEVIANKYSYKDYSNNPYYGVDYCPTIVEPRILVIPVWFTDSSSYMTDTGKMQVRDDIRKAYAGTDFETGWNSVSSFYEKESEGKCKLQATISEWYPDTNKSSYYYDGEDGLFRTMELLERAVEWYFTNNPEDSKTNYDLDKNGQYDGVMLIYGSPDYSVLPSIDSTDKSNMWAYCNWTYNEPSQDLNNPSVNVYFWASYDFMYSNGTSAKSRTGKSESGSGDTSHCFVDAHTFIHEMGHVLGLEDYYDYSRGGYCPAGAFSMQDYNVGGHDPYSLMAFNWVDPIVIHRDCTIELKTFQDSHELILLSNTSTYSGSPFDEYMLVELYSPTGLNEFDSTYQYQGAYPKGIGKLGIRLWHVDARLAYFQGNEVITNEMYNDPTNPDYKVNHAFSNTYEDRDYGSVLGKYNSQFYYYNILQLIRNDTKANYKNKRRVKEADLFYEGDSYKQFDFSSQFINGNRLNNMESLNWSFKINSISESSASITFTHLGQ